jgi:hypothetical protein
MGIYIKSNLTALGAVRAVMCAKTVRQSSKEHNYDDGDDDDNDDDECDIR